MFSGQFRTDPAVALKTQKPSRPRPQNPQNTKSMTTNYYPSANAVLVDAPAATRNPKELSLQDQYATAQVVGTDVSPFSTRLVHATETHATATALDPWSKEKTVASETEEQQNNETPTFVYRPPSSEYISPNEHNNHNNGTTNYLPAAALENTAHKKYRRCKRRRRRMVLGGATGFVVGSILLGPFGGIALGFGGASATKAISKARERRKDRRVRKRIQRLQHQCEEGQLQRVVISRR